MRLQYAYETIVIVADLHMLTTKRTREDVENLLPNVRGLVLDYLASGMDPERSCIYLQSAVPQTHELHTYRPDHFERNGQGSPDRLGNDGGGKREDGDQTSVGDFKNRITGEWANG